MADVAVERANVDDVRSILSRRRVDDLTMRLSLELVERGSAWTARDDGAAIASLVCDESEDERYAGDLFVEPSFRGQRIASRLLDVAFEDSANKARTVALEAGDSAGIALALRRGLGRHETVLRLAGGIPKEEELARMAAGDYRFQVDVLDPVAHGPAVAALDREVRATARPENHRLWSLQSAPLAFFVNGEFVGYAHVWPDGRIGPCATVSGAYARQLYAFSMLALQRTYGASWCTLLVPASNVRVSRAALYAGLRIEETFSIAGDNAAAALDRYVGFHRVMF